MGAACFGCHQGACNFVDPWRRSGETQVEPVKREANEIRIHSLDGIVVLWK